MANERAVYLKVGVKDQEAFRQALQAMGKDGESMLRRIEMAAAPASRSLVAVSAAATELRAQITAAGSSLGPLSAGLGALGGAAGVVGLGVAGLAVGFIALTKRALDSADAIGDAADALGLSVKAYQTYSGAAKLAGVSAEQFEAGIRILQDRLSNAAQKGGEAAAPFRQLGVAFQTASGQARSAEDVFDELAEAFKGVENPAERVRLALDVLGKSGSRFLPLFSEGADGLRKFAAEAEALGLVIDERLIRQAGEANDRLEIMSQVIGTKLTQAFLNVAPYVDKFASFLLALSGGSSKPISAQIVELNKELVAAEDHLKVLEERFAANPAKEIILDSWRKKVEALRSQVDGLIETARREIAPPTSAPATPAGVKPSGALTAAELDELRKKFLELKGAAEPAAKAQQEFAEKTALVQKALEAGITDLAEAQRLYGELAGVRDKAIADADKEGEQLVKAWQEQEKRNAGLEKYIAGLEDHARAAGLSATEEKVLLAVNEAQSKLVDELGRRTRDLTDAEKDRIRTAVESKVAFDEAQKQAEKFQQDQQRLIERSADRLVDAGADFLFDYMEGRSSDLWDNFTKWGKRAFAQLLAEQFLRPIAVNIVSNALGVPQAAGQSPTTFNPLSAFQMAGQAKQGFDVLGNIPSILKSIFSPDNFIANMFPSIFGPGLAGGAAIAAGLTGPAGFALGGGAASSLAVGTAAGPLAAMAPFLPVLAIALPFLLKGILGGKTSVGPNANAIINFERDADGRLTNPGGLAIGGLGADNGGDRSLARQMAEAATKTVNTIVDRLGGRITGVPGAGQSGQLELGYFAEGGRYFSVVGGTKAEFGSAEEAVADFARRTIQAATVEGLSPDVNLALSRSVAKSVEELGKDVDFASGFRRQVNLADAGPGTRRAQLLGFRYAGEDAAAQQRTSIRDFVADARRLFGEDSTQLEDAKATARNRALALVGLGPDTDLEANKPLEGMAATIAATRENFLALKETLVDTGLTATEAQAKIDEGLVKTFAKLAADAETAVGDALLASESPAAAQARALLAAQGRRRGDLVDLQAAAGLATDTSTVDRLSASELRQFLDGADLKGLADIIRNIGEVVKDAPDGTEASLRADIRARADKAIGDLLLANDSPAAAQAKAIAEAQRSRRENATAAGADISGLDRLDRAELGQALKGATLDELTKVEEEMRRLGELSPAMVAALADARTLATEIAAATEQAAQRAAELAAFTAASQAAIAVDTARWAYEERQATEDLADAKAAYIDVLNREISTLDATAERFQAFADQLGDARRGLLIGDLSPLSRTDRYAEATRQRDEIARRARLGDERAIEQLAGIVEAQLRASRDVNASDLNYVRDFNEGQAILAEVETVASRHARIAAESRDLLRDQLEEVTGQSQDLQTIAEAAAAWRAAQLAAGTGGAARAVQQRGAFDTLAADFIRLHRAAPSQAEKDQVYAAIAPQRDALLGAISDAETLQGILRDYYQGNTTDSGGVFIRSRLYSMNQVPRYAAGTGGGTAEGWAWVGEQGPELAYFNQAARIYPANESRAIASSSGSGSANVVRVLERIAAGQDGLRADLRDQGLRLQTLEAERAVGTYARGRR